MLFSSMTFVFVFLPLVCLIYFLARKELQNYILLIASILFYAWGEPRYLAIMILTILVNYAGANYIDRSKKPYHRKFILLMTIFVDLSFLFYFKYFNFMMDNINSLLHAQIDFINVVMPIGISFYTFQALSYVVDVYRGDVKAQKDIYKLALYICLFPQLVAGPIVKYHDVEEQISARGVIFDEVAYGVKRFIIGLSKKMLLANTFGAVADKVFNQPVEQIDCLTAWLGIVMYTLQIYYDFSGYSDMAIGLGAIFGFKFMENFNYPYISKSITEFWHRWHISLSTWFKEYLYIPLGGNRVSKARNYFNLLVVFLTTGFWHGASWNFVIWGVWHGVFIVLEKMTGWHKKEYGWLMSVVQHVYCLLVVIFGFVMFRSDTMLYAVRYMLKMLGWGESVQQVYKLEYYVNHVQILAFGVALVLCTPVFSKILQIGRQYNCLKIIVNIWLMFLFILSVSSIAASTYNPFIYFRF